MKTAKEIYMKTQIKYPMEFGAYTIPSDWQLEAMETYANQFKPIWISASKQPKEGTKRVYALYNTGRMDTASVFDHLDWHVYCESRGIMEYTYLPEKEL